MSELIENLTDANFESAVASSDKPMLVDFWAPWCAPCKQIAPILEEVAEEMGDAVKICKLNVEEHQQAAQKFGIRAIPTLLFFRNGEKVDELVGMSSKEDIKAKLS